MNIDTLKNIKVSRILAAMERLLNMDIVKAIYCLLLLATVVVVRLPNTPTIKPKKDILSTIIMGSYLLIALITW